MSGKKPGTGIFGLPTDQTRAMRAWIGDAIPLDGQEPETATQRVLALQRHLRQAEIDRRPNPYQTDFVKFLSELCYTRDEARGGKVAQVPKWPFFPELADALLERNLLFIEKSRRVMASWLVCCFDIWIAAGGQDPRWPVLMNSTGYRAVTVGARKFDSACWFLENRIKFIVDQFEERGFREKWPAFPTWQWKQGLGTASNGSTISACAQGADQLRGQGATLLHFEELAFWEQARQSVEASLPVLHGGGHVVAVTTPNASSYAALIVSGNLRDSGWRK